MQENREDRNARWRSRIAFAFFLAYCAMVVYLLINPATRIIGVFNVIPVAFIISHYFLKWAAFEPDYLWRKLVHHGWHGKYRAFEGQRVRVIDGERHTPSRVFAYDVFKILGQRPSLTDLEKL